MMNIVKPILSGHSEWTQKLVFNTENRLMQVKSIAECSIKLPFSMKTFVLSILSRRLRQVLL